MLGPPPSGVARVEHRLGEVLAEALAALLRPLGSAQPAVPSSVPERVAALLPSGGKAAAPGKARPGGEQGRQQRPAREGQEDTEQQGAAPWKQGEGLMVRTGLGNPALLPESRTTPVEGGGE